VHTAMPLAMVLWVFADCQFGKRRVLDQLVLAALHYNMVSGAPVVCSAVLPLSY